MTIKCSVFIATSLDGFIARKDGSIDWLMQANSLAQPGEDCGYQSFISTIDTLVLGRHSYETILTFNEWPYGDLPVVVLSNQPITIPAHLANLVSMSSETPKDLVKRLSKQGAKHLYIDGGITIQRFLNDGLIDEMIITLIPVLLGEGRALFGPLEKDIELKHLETHTFDGGFVQLKYDVQRTQLVGNGIK